jgi:hypothetical protein
MNQVFDNTTVDQMEWVKRSTADIMTVDDLLSA